MQLVEDRSRWADLIRFDPTSRYRTRVDVDGDYEAWLLTWLPGQHSGWHDHGGSAGAVVVLQGILTEQRGIDHRDGPPRIADFSCQYADVSVRSFGTRHLHLLGNATPRPAVSLHLYRPAPTEFGVFRVNGAHLERTTPS